MLSGVANKPMRAYDRNEKQAKTNNFLIAFSWSIVRVPTNGFLADFMIVILLHMFIDILQDEGEEMEEEGMDLVMKSNNFSLQAGERKILSVARSTY